MGFGGMGASVRPEEGHGFLGGLVPCPGDINQRGQLQAVIRGREWRLALLPGVDAIAGRAAVINVIVGALCEFGGRRLVKPAALRKRWSIL